MYVTNIWGILFCIYFPTLLVVYGAYKAGIEEGKKRYFNSFKRKNQRRRK